MRKFKIYLETTLFNYYFDIERDAHVDTVKLFEEIATGKYEAYTSDYVVKELEAAPTEKREKMLALINKYGITVLGISGDAEKLANEYVITGVIPGKYLTDGLHIAIATINGLDIIISLNFKHIVKRKTIEQAGFINSRNGYKRIEIYSPMEVVEDE